MTPPQDTASPPTLAIEGAVARIELARPEQHNAIEVEDIARLGEHLERVDADLGVRVLVVTGRGRTFCAGASLPQIESGEMTGALFEMLADRLSGTRVPTICALNGSVHGGGTELALCCDLRIGVPASRMAVPAARLGLCYPLAGLRRYAEALGLGTASRLLLAGEELDSGEMLEIGFLHHLVPREQLERETDALARRIAGLAPLAVQAMKHLLRRIAGGEVDEELARQLVDRCASSEDLREGLRAWRRRRAPEFHGA